MFCALLSFGQGVTTTSNAGGNPAVNLNAASGSATYVIRPATSSCSNSATNMYRIGDGSGRVELCLTDFSNLSTTCGGGNNKDDVFRIYSDQNLDGNPETVYSWFSPASASMEMNVTGSGVFDCQNCVMSASGSGYLWVYYCGVNTCDAADMAASGVSFTWNTYPTSTNNPISSAEPIDTCSQTFTANNYDADFENCGGYAVNWNNDVDCNDGTALAAAPFNTDFGDGSGGGGDVGYSVESDIWFAFNPGIIGTWTLDFTPYDCFATNGISSGSDACDFYSNGFQYALFEGTSSTNFTSLISGGTNGMDLNVAQSISINVVSTATNYYLQIEGYAGVGCKFDAVLTPPGAVCTLLPLPVNLINFTAQAIDNSFVQIDWETETEINNNFFTIERSSTGDVFEVVGIVDGAGNSSMVRNYDINDTDPYKGTSYYRLKQTDYDGSSEYSKTVSVEIKSPYSDLVIYPNPVKSNSLLKFSSEEDGEAQVLILDVSGRKVIANKYNVTKGSNKLEILTTELSSGMYFLTIGNDTQRFNVKFIKD